MTEDDDRLRCWAVGVRFQEELSELLDAADRARDDTPTERGAPPNPPGLQRIVAETNREVILGWARKVDDLLRESEKCGVESNGYIGGQFGRIEEWEEYGADRLEQLADRVSGFVLDVHKSVRDEPAPGEETGRGRSARDLGRRLSPTFGAEEQWDRLSQKERDEILRSLGETPATLEGMGRRPFGSLPPDVIDVLEARSAVGKRITEE